MLYTPNTSCKISLFKHKTGQNNQKPYVSLSPNTDTNFHFGGKIF